MAPASQAAFASAAICSGVTGTGCREGSVSTPVRAQEITQGSADIGLRGRVEERL